MSDNPVLPGLLRSVAKLRHRLNTATADTGSRQRINWVDTGTVTWAITDSSVNEEMSVSATTVTDAAGSIPKSIGTTKGDIIAWSSSAVPARLGVGSDGQILTADAASSSGVKWAAAPSGYLGTLGYAQTTSLTQSYTTIANVTGLTVTATVTSGHRIRISGSLGCTAADTTGLSTLYIRESTTKLATVVFYMTATDGSGGSSANHIAAVVTPSAGSHTYVLSIERTTGTSCVATTSIITPAYILVEDIGT